MGRLRGDWRDLFSGFVIALDVRKLVLALTGALLVFLFVFLPAPWIAIGYDKGLSAELGATSQPISAPGRCWPDAARRRTACS